MDIKTGESICFRPFVLGLRILSYELYVRSERCVRLAARVTFFPYVEKDLRSLFMDVHEATISRGAATVSLYHYIPICQIRCSGEFLTDPLVLNGDPFEDLSISTCPPIGIFVCSDPNTEVSRVF